MNNEELNKQLRECLEVMVYGCNGLLLSPADSIALGLIKGHINRKKRIRKMNHERIKKKNKHMVIY